MRSLAAEIDHAFAGLEPPIDDELLHPACMDDVDVLDFRGRVRREDLGPERIAYNYAALGAFSPLAFRYYLPAYLLWTLDNLDSTEYAAESTLLALDPGTEREMLHDFRKSKYSLLSGAQVRAVTRLLWHVATHEDLGEYAERALINHWIDAAADAEPGARRQPE